MHTLFALLVLSVTLSPPFGNAEARAVESGPDGMVLEVEVVVDESALVVLARGIGDVDELPPVALAELSPGRWGGIVEVPVVQDILLGFELIRPDGGSAVVSEVHRLTELGVDPAVFASAGPTTTLGGGSGDPVAVVEGPGDDGPSTAPIWLGIAAGAAALALLLVWWLPSRSEEDSGDGDDGDDDDGGGAEAAIAGPG